MTIDEQVLAICQQYSKGAGYTEQVTPKHMLSELQLDSLDFAEIILELEDKMSVNLDAVQHSLDMTVREFATQIKTRGVLYRTDVPKVAGDA